MDLIAIAVPFFLLALIIELIMDWRKGLLLLGASAALIGVTVLGFHLATDGWFTFFVFGMPSKHIDQEGYVAIFLDDLVPILPLVLLSLGGSLWLLRVT